MYPSRSRAIDLNNFLISSQCLSRFHEETTSGVGPPCTAYSIINAAKPAAIGVATDEPLATRKLSDRWFGKSRGHAAATRLAENCEITVRSCWRVVVRRVTVAIAGVYTDDLSHIGRKRYRAPWVDSGVGGCGKDNDRFMESISQGYFDRFALYPVAKRDRNEMHSLFSCPLYHLT